MVNAEKIENKIICSHYLLKISCISEVDLKRESKRVIGHNIYKMNKFDKDLI